MTGIITNKVNSLQRIKWEIPYYYSHSQRADEPIMSPDICFSGRNWELRVYPNGRRVDYSVEWVGLYLYDKTPGNPPKSNLAFRFFLEYYEDGHYQRFSSDGLHALCCLSGMHGVSRFIGRLELRQERAKLVPNGLLRVLVEVDVPSGVCYDAETQTTSFDSSNTLANDFRFLLVSEQNSDLTINVGARSFKAHKLILRARSSVFDAMFKHDMRENNCSVIDIVDCEPDIFGIFLEFLYTGSLESLSSENVSQLLTVADKYDLPDLREKCLLHMRGSLSLDIVCDVLDAANKYDEEELLDAARDLVIRNIREVTRTQKWMRFMRNNPTLGTEILMSLILVS